jgi:hypothetical protein
MEGKASQLPQSCEKSFAALVNPGFQSKPLGWNLRTLSALCGLSFHSLYLDRSVNQRMRGQLN